MLDVKRNLTTMTDFYELTMSAGYLDEGYKDKIAVFDMFFRKVPDGGGYAIMAGLEQFINAVDSLKFTEEDINYLRSTGAFNEQFLDYLRNFKLHCNIWAIEEGMPIFPQEPIVTVEGPAIECQLLETLLLVTFNHQCLIATKANRICRAAAVMAPRGLSVRIQRLGIGQFRQFVVAFGLFPRQFALDTIDAVQLRGHVIADPRLRADLNPLPAMADEGTAARSMSLVNGSSCATMREPGTMARV